MLSVGVTEPAGEVLAPAEIQLKEEEEEEEAEAQVF